MFVQRGDRICVRTRETGQVREALVLDVQGSSGRPPYRVRWTDTGREDTVVPGPDVSVDRAGPVSVDRAGPDYPPEHEPRLVAPPPTPTQAPVQAPVQASVQAPVQAPPGPDTDR